MTDNFTNKVDSFHQTSETTQTGDLKIIKDFRELKTKKAFIVAVIATTAIALVGLMAIVSNFNKKDIDYAVIYEKNGDVLLKTNSFEADLQNNAYGDVIFTNDGKHLFYSVASSKGNDMFDIYSCSTRNMKSLQSGGEIVVSGVLQDYRLSSQGEYLIYSKKSAGSSTLYNYDINKGKSEEISKGIEKAFYTKNAVVFFIKTLDAKRVLMRYTPGQVSEQLDIYVEDAHLYESQEEVQFVFTTQKGEGEEAFTLKIISDTSGVEKIADDVVHVNYDDYKCGDNLYYFKKSEMGVSWRNIISDDKLSSDSQLQEPVKDDYKISLLGFNAYDLVSYKKAVDEYDKKLGRDDFRAQLEEKLADGNLVFPTYTCYAYDGSAEHKLAENISISNVLEYSKKGEPRVVYIYTDYITAEESPISINDVLDISQANGDNASEYAISIIESAMTEPEYQLSNPAGSEDSISLNGYPVKKSVFSFYNDGSALIAMVKDNYGDKSTLSISSITQYGVSEKKVIDTNVTEYICTNNGVYYLKLDDNKDTGSLFVFNENEKIKINNKILDMNDFDNDILYLCESDTQNIGSSVDVYVYANGKNSLLSQGISISDIVYSDSNHIAYIKDKTEGSQGDLYIYSGNGRNELLDNGVTGIMNVTV
ncbi:MAG TPA: hypothetical protein VFD52_06410 [Clostridia bacterium]|nr:hypothetical protein [Clostridia bacterium]